MGPRKGGAVMADEGIDPEEYLKICDDPIAEYEKLAARLLKWQEDSQYTVNWPMFHVVLMMRGSLKDVAEEFRYDEVLAIKYPHKQDYVWRFHGTRLAFLAMIRHCREQLDALDARNVAVQTLEMIVRGEVARDIRSELVCCDIYGQIDAIWKADPDPDAGRTAMAALMQGPDYHAICHWGGYAARIAERGDE